MNSSGLSKLGRRTAAPPISWLMHEALSRPKLISLAAGFTDNESLPVSETRRLIRQILKTPATAQSALQYGTTQGDLTLRQLTIQRLRRQDGVPASWPAYSSERVVITNGSQQLLYAVTEALCDTDDIVLVEDPTYFVYLGILQSHGVRTRGVRLDRQGLDIGHLEEVLRALARDGELRRVKLLYLVSYFQNPTGVTTSFEKKKAALAVLRKFERMAGHPIYLLEDAAYRELRFAGKDVPSALAVPGFMRRGIYAGTYSKPFATGARVGFGVLPPSLLGPVLHIKGNHDFGASNLLQQLLRQAISSGLYQKHLIQSRKRYARKAKIMEKALLEHFPPSVEWWRPSGGLYFWARLPRHLSSGVNSRVFKSALKHNVLYVPGEICYAENSDRARPDHEMRISFGNATEEHIQEGIARLGAVLWSSGFQKR